MKSQLLFIAGASSLSLVIGYMVGKNASSDSIEDTAIVSPEGSSHQQASKRSSGGSASGARARRLRPTTAQGRADLALRSAKTRLDDSAMINMDFAVIADVWRMLDGLNAEELELVLAGMDKGGGMNQSNMLLEMMLLSRWGEVDGKSAVEHVMSQDKKGMMKMVGLMGSISAWMKVDPIAAEAWFDEHKDEFKGGMFGSKMIEEVFLNALAKKDLSAALAKMDLAKKSDRDKAVQAISSLITDPEKRDEVIAKVNELEDEELREKMYQGMVQTLSYQDPDAAAELVERLGEKSPGQMEEFREKLLDGMRMHDPMAALEYSQTEFAEGEKRDKAVKDSFVSLARQDSDAAREWMLANGKNNDEYLSLAVDRLNWQTPERAMDWALEIADDDLRTKKVVKSYKRWAEGHAAGAKEWLDRQDVETQAAIKEGVSE